MDIFNRIVTELEEPRNPYLQKIINMIGEEDATRFLEQTLKLIAGGYEEAKANSALLRQDGHPRTKGGTFFYLVKGGVSEDLRKKIWPPRPRQKPYMGLAYQMQNTLFEKEMGVAELEVEISGYPIKIGRKKGIVSARVEVDIDSSKLPASLPWPPGPSSYQILMQEADYEGVMEAVEEQGMLLKVKGYCHINKKQGVGMVFAYEVTSVAPVTEAEDV